MKKEKLNIGVHLFLIFLCLVCIIPFVLLISSSLTDENILVTNGYSLIPGKLSFDAYTYILTGSAGTVLRGYLISIFVTVVGTALSLVITVLFAYPLSRKDLPFRKGFAFFVFFTMLFNGGLVPSYMMWTQLFHIKNTIAALILPNLLMNAFYVIMMRTYFASSISQELLEAARIDGAGEMRILGSIALPLSKPMLATIGFMTALGYWNDWMNGLYYITDTDYFSIQNILNKMLTDAQFLSSSAAAQFSQMADISVPSVGIRMAVAVIGLLPMLIAYPFFQRYFIRGIALGGVKG